MLPLDYMNLLALNDMSGPPPLHWSDLSILLSACTHESNCLHGQDLGTLTECDEQKDATSTEQWSVDIRAH